MGAPGIGGAGVGGSVGGPSVPQAFQPDQNASIQTMKNLLGIRPAETFDVVPFTQTTNPKDTWKYHSTSGNPLLDHPTSVFRAGTGLIDIPDDLWRDNYNFMFKGLPSDLQNLLKANLLLPSTQRNPYLSALDDVLQASARFMAQLDIGVSQLDLENVVTAQLLNQTLPLYALSCLSQAGNDILTQTQTVLDTLGPNDPSYDKITNVLNQTKDLLTKLNAVSDALKTPQDSTKAKALLADLSQSITDLESQAEVLLSEKPIHVLQVLITDMAIIAGSASLGDTSAWMLLALGPALSAFGNPPESQKAFSFLATLLGSTLDALLFKQPDASYSALLKKLIGATMITTYTTALATTGAMSRSTEEEGEEDSPRMTVRQSFAFELSMIFLLSTDTIQTIFRKLGSALGASVEGQQVASAFLTTALLFMIGTVLAPSGAAPLLTDQMKKTLFESLSQLDKAIDTAILKGNVNADKLGEIRVAVGQAAIALTKNDMETFWNQYAAALQVGGLDIQKVTQESHYIQSVASVIQKVLTPGSEQTPTIITMA